MLLNKFYIYFVLLFKIMDYIYDIYIYLSLAFYICHVDLFGETTMFLFFCVWYI